jgi:hypothetical protein
VPGANGNDAGNWLGPLPQPVMRVTARTVACRNMLVTQLLTQKLRGRATPSQGGEGAQFLSARGANLIPNHGPFQRLLEPLSGGTNRSRPSDPAKGQIALEH